MQTRTFFCPNTQSSSPAILPEVSQGPKFSRFDVLLIPASRSPGSSWTSKWAVQLLATTAVEHLLLSVRSVAQQDVFVVYMADIEQANVDVSSGYVARNSHLKLQ